MTDNVQPAPQKKVLIETWGCQMNVADSETMLSQLEKSNYTLTQTEEDADLIVLNTCHIREKAKHKVLSRLGKLKEMKGRRPALKIAVTGCVAQAEGKKLLAEAPQIDVLIGPGKIDELSTLLETQENAGGQHTSIGFPRHEDLASEKPQPQSKTSVTGRHEVSRFVNIAQGCDNFCTFCVVPFTRGREISRRPSDILAECRGLIEDGGAKEITLLGQNVNSYGSDLVRDAKLVSSENGPFVDLLDQVSQLPGLERLRFTTSNPHDFTKPLAKLFQDRPKLGKYIHLPVQSGNDTVLERMKRKVTVDDYLERITWLRNVDPSFAISTDLIVGFPGETEEQFEDTLRLVEKVRYSFIFSFMYSSRKNTAAARFKDQIPETVKQDRLKRLISLQEKITLEENLKQIGKEETILFLYHSQKRPGSYFGRCDHNRLVRVDSSTNLVGQRHVALIKEANKTAMTGELLNN